MSQEFVDLWGVASLTEVSLAGVGKVYADGTRAVTDLSIDVTDGEFLVLVGPSGCGKSTALRMIAGLEDISEGTITIGGRVVNNIPSRDRDVAMVFQSYALYPHLNVRDNIGQTRQFGSSLDVLSSGSFLSLIVPLIVFFAFQRYFVQGMMAGSVK